jgi:hypothetical protein
VLRFPKREEHRKKVIDGRGFCPDVRKISFANVAIIISLPFYKRLKDQSAASKHNAHCSHTHSGCHLAAKNAKMAERFNNLRAISRREKPSTIN